MHNLYILTEMWLYCNRAYYWNIPEKIDLYFSCWDYGRTDYFFTCTSRVTVYAS